MRYNNLMYLIVGLGNPGKKYERNRHNAGFMCVERFASLCDPDARFSGSPKFETEATEVTVNSQKCIIIKPQTYMNLSGVPTQRTAGFYKIDASHVIVAHDDLDIPIGQFKIQMATGPKLHNGLSSINQKLGTDQYLRVRIGVENRRGQRIPGEAYVLQDFTDEEISLLAPVLHQIHERLVKEYIR